MLEVTEEAWDYLVGDLIKLYFEEKRTEGADTQDLLSSLRVRKPVIYLSSPDQVEARVRLGLVREWEFTVIYPVVPIKAEPGKVHQTMEWNVQTRTDGSLYETNTGLEVAYLFWEAQ